LPRARRQGAHSALIAARGLSRAGGGLRLSGCGDGTEGPGEHNPSLYNMVRAGMSVRYERRNWICNSQAE
jgi:hypothetical protein